MTRRQNNLGPPAGSTRSDWRLLPYAPGLHCLQALAVGGGTASGAGIKQEDAQIRCVGELAEIEAIRHIDEQKRSEPRWRGTAAHVDDDAAREKALLEALERCAADLWWQGRAPAIPVESSNRIGLQIEEDLARIRGESAAHRSTKLYRLETFSPLPIYLAISHEPDDLQTEYLTIVWGYGAALHQRDAARSAIIETAMMELNLVDAVSEKQVQRRVELARSLIHRHDLFTTPSPDSGKQEQTPDSLGPIVRSRGITVSYNQLSAPSSPLVVWDATLHTPPTFGRPHPLSQRMLL